MGDSKIPARPSSGSSRRWRIPPAMLLAPGERLDGERILAESPGDLGLLLWRTMRDVSLWASTPDTLRDQLFADGSADVRVARIAATEVPAAISASVDTIHAMLTLASRADGSVLSISCLEIAAWARNPGLVHTAVAFAQAGALAAPEFAEAALHTGIFASEAGQDARAETWLRRALGLARREKDRAAFSAALVELGDLYARGGDTARAEQRYRMGFRAGRRFAIPSARMFAAYGMFRLARAKGDGTAAARFSAVAQGSYLPGVRGGAEMLVDFARWWTDAGEGDHARAALCRLASSRADLPSEGRLAAAALTARAYAGGGPGSVSHAGAAAEAWQLASDEAMADAVRLAAVLDLAHAARLAGDLVAFTRAKRAALSLAPQDEYPSVVRQVADLWPDGEAPAATLDRAS